MLAHDRTGAGPPLVLLHFLGGHRRVWRSLVPALQDQREVVVVDLPGFGESRPLAGSPTVARVADAVARTIEGLGVSRPAVAGIALGGSVAIELARRDLVSNATAISPIGFATRPEAAFAKASLRATVAACRALAPRADALAAQGPVRAALGAQMFAKPTAVPPADAADLVRSVAHAPGMLPTLRAAMGHEVVAGALTVPVTVAWGQRDALFPPRQGARAVERLPFSRLVPLAGCGHVPIWDAPELVTRVLLDGSTPR